MSSRSSIFAAHEPKNGFYHRHAEWAGFVVNTGWTHGRNSGQLLADAFFQPDEISYMSRGLVFTDQGDAFYRFRMGFAFSCKDSNRVGMIPAFYPAESSCIRRFYVSEAHLGNGVIPPRRSEGCPANSRNAETRPSSIEIKGGSCCSSPHG